MNKICDFVEYGLDQMDDVIHGVVNCVIAVVVPVACFIVFAFALVIATPFAVFRFIKERLRAG